MAKEKQELKLTALQKEGLKKLAHFIMDAVGAKAWQDAVQPALEYLMKNDYLLDEADEKEVDKTIKEILDDVPSAEKDQRKQYQLVAKFFSFLNTGLSQVGLAQQDHIAKLGNQILSASKTLSAKAKK